MARGKSSNSTLRIDSIDGGIHTAVVCTLCISKNPAALVHNFRNKDNLGQHMRRWHRPIQKTAIISKTCVILYRHSQAGKALAAFLKLKFEARGVKVWRDVKNLQSAQQLKGEIQSQIEACDHAVVLLSSGDLDECSSDKNDFFSWELRTCMKRLCETTHWIMSNEIFDQIATDESMTRRGLLADIKALCKARLILKWNTDVDLQQLADSVLRFDKQ